MTTAELIQIFSGFAGSLGFAVLFNIRGKRLAAAGIGSLLSWLLFLLLTRGIPNEAVCYFLVALLISGYSELLARVMKTPSTTFVIPALIPLIPGGSLYYTMASAFAGENGNFVEKGLSTLQLSAALALGILLATALSRFVFWKRK